jgi:hypothetical protein
MSISDKLIKQEAVPSGKERRKRLGQYFTGTQLGRILASLAGAPGASSIIDPMAGSGDLLAACLELKANPKTIGAVDVDPHAVSECMRRIPKAHCVVGSAFSSKTLSKLPHLQWDLVITNPPYVRYQSISKGVELDISLPSAKEIRKGLLECIEIMPNLDCEDKSLFSSLARGYSGLADLAVPSWILSAALVAPGGRLALVVPESWLSRDYASVVHYLLLRWFDIEFIVEDEHAVWFADAQVKTTLLVAKRIPRRVGAFNFSSESAFLRIVISGKATGNAGPCSFLMQDTRGAEKAFAKKARKWLTSRSSHEDSMIRAYCVPLNRTAQNLRGACAKKKWLIQMGEEASEESATLPHELETWVHRSHEPSSIVTLSSMGVSIGQGLRTGANSFFYGEKSPNKNSTTIIFDKNSVELKINSIGDIAVPVVRKQSDLPNGYTISPVKVAGRVLDLHGHAMPDDIRGGGELATLAYKVIPAGLDDWVRTACLQNYGKDGDKKIWELSAVAPNVRKANPANGAAPRFWYMLPDFAQRHRPDILIARVNSGKPKAFLNKRRGAIVDANFSTLWIVNETSVNNYTLLALLNSSWCVAALEYSAAIMGGGALKVEATHLRRLPIPFLGGREREALIELGQRLSKSCRDKTVNCILSEIDRVVASAALGRKASKNDIDELKTLVKAGRSKRKLHNTKGN